MDEYTGQKAVSGLSISRRGSSLSFRDSNHEDRSIRYCNRLGCSTRPNSMKGSNSANLAKYSKPSLRSSSSKTMVGSSSSSKTTVGSSSKSLVGTSNLRKHHHPEQQNLTSLRETIISKNSCVQGGVEAVEPIPSATGIQTDQTEPENAEGVVCYGLSLTNSTEEMGNTRPQKKNQQSAFGNQDTSLGSPIRLSFSSRNTNETLRPQGQGSNVRRYGLRNIGCASISDVFPSSSLSDYSCRNINMIKRRCPPDGESSARGKKAIGSSSGANSQRNTPSSPSPSSTDRLTSQLTSRRVRNWSAGSSSVASVRTRRTINGDTSMMLSRTDSDNMVSMPEHMMIPRLPHEEFSINESAASGLSRSFTTELPSVRQNSFRRPGSSSETVRSRPTAHSEDNSAQPFHSFSTDRDGFRRFNMEGIAEVLLALERIEQDEELTYEQLLVLESNLLLGGLSYHDQHRDMRLDIDNMSYEELLALEEKMGTVSTALTEEQLSKCLKRSCFVPPPLATGIVGHGTDDTKCSICQEEYMVGDEMGKLRCEHRFHIECIDQWLRQKNWCPICKASALPSGSSPKQAAGGANHFV
ncbi:hypothetical protein AAC387_Pa03g0114 [Persea americana]